MADVFTKAKCSAVMSLIRGSGSETTELGLIAIFEAHGITGWRRRSPLVGKQDCLFPKLTLAVLVGGCFWRGGPIYATQPKSNTEFWQTKIVRNQARDRLVTRTLRRDGWRVLRIWEHELARKKACRLAGRLRRTGLLPRLAG